MESLSLYTRISLVNKLNTAKKVVSNFGHPFLHTENVKIIVQIKFCWADEIQLFGFRWTANRRRQTPSDAVYDAIRPTNCPFPLRRPTDYFTVGRLVGSKNRLVGVVDTRGNIRKHTCKRIYITHTLINANIKQMKLYLNW